MQHPMLRVLVVDDQSPDGTGEIAETLARAHPGRIDVIHRTGRRGLGRAYIDGFRRAIAEPVDVICQMDADLSHDPRQLPELIAAAAHADVVIGSRYIPGGRDRELAEAPRDPEPIRQHLHARRSRGLSVRDCTAGYRCWRRETLARCRSIGSSPTAIRSRSRCCSSRRASASGSPRCRSRSSSGGRGTRRSRGAC